MFGTCWRLCHHPPLLTIINQVVTKTNKKQRKHKRKRKKKRQEVKEVKKVIMLQSLLIILCMNFCRVQAGFEYEYDLHVPRDVYLENGEKYNDNDYLPQNQWFEMTNVNLEIIEQGENVHFAVNNNMNFFLNFYKKGDNAKTCLLDSKYCDEHQYVGDEQGEHPANNQVYETGSVYNLAPGNYSFEIRCHDFQGWVSVGYCFPIIGFTFDRVYTGGETPDPDCNKDFNDGIVCADVRVQGRWVGSWLNGVKEVTVGITETTVSTKGESLTSAVTKASTEEFSNSWSATVGAGIQVGYENEFLGTGGGLSAKIETSTTVSGTTTQSMTTSNTVTESYATSVSETFAITTSTSCSPRFSAPEEGVDYLYFQWIYEVIDKNTSETLAVARECTYERVTTDYMAPLCPPDACIDTYCQRCKLGTFEDPDFDTYMNSEKKYLSTNYNNDDDLLGK